MLLQSSWCFILRHRTVYGGMKVNWITVTKCQVRPCKELPGELGECQTRVSFNNRWFSPWPRPAGSSCTVLYCTVLYCTGSHPGLALLAGAPAGAAGHRSEDPEALGLGEPGPLALALALALAAAVPRYLHLHLGAGAGQDLPHLGHKTGLTFIIHLQCPHHL